MEIERTVIGGRQTKLELEPEGERVMGEEKVKIISYRVKTETNSRYQRRPSQEGRVVRFSELKLEQSFNKLFGK